MNERNPLREPRRWTWNHPDGGRFDVNGVQWFACDPYPTWYRWEDGELIRRGRDGDWADERPARPKPTGIGSLVTELRDALEQLDAAPQGRYWPVQTSAVIDCARDVVAEWEKRRAQR